MRHVPVWLRVVILLALSLALPDFSAVERRSDLPALADARAALPQADLVSSFWFLIVAGAPEASLSVEKPVVGLTQVDLYHSLVVDLCLVASMCQTQVALLPVESHPALSVRWT